MKIPRPSPTKLMISPSVPKSLKPIAVTEQAEDQVEHQRTKKPSTAIVTYFRIRVGDLDVEELVRRQRGDEGSHRAEHGADDDAVGQAR